MAHLLKGLKSCQITFPAGQGNCFPIADSRWEVLHFMLGCTFSASQSNRGEQFYIFNKKRKVFAGPELRGKYVAVSQQE